MNRLKEIFWSRNINVAKFARECDIPPTTLYGLLDGSKTIDGFGTGRYLRMCKGLGCDPRELYDELKASGM